MQTDRHTDMLIAYFAPIRGRGGRQSNNCFKKYAEQVQQETVKVVLKVTETRNMQPKNWAWNNNDMYQHATGKYLLLLERCNPWPHVANRHISITQLVSLWHHSYYDVWRLRRSQPPFPLWRDFHYDVSRAYGDPSPSSHYDVILIVTSFATDLATPTVTDVRTLRTPCRV